MWRNYFNKERPHSSLGFMTPDEFASLPSLLIPLRSNVVDGRDLTGEVEKKRIKQ
jgi:hypothetical protein